MRPGGFLILFNALFPVQSKFSLNISCEGKQMSNALHCAFKGVIFSFFGFPRHTLSQRHVYCPKFSDEETEA